MPKPKSPHKKPERSEKESVQYLKGEVRQLKKRCKILERENSRLNKYLRAAISWLPDDEESVDTPIPSLRPTEWTCKPCGHTKKTEIVLPQADGKVTRKHVKCLNCGHKELYIEQVDE